MSDILQVVEWRPATWTNFQQHPPPLSSRCVLIYVLSAEGLLDGLGLLLLPSWTEIKEGSRRKRTRRRRRRNTHTLTHTHTHTLTDRRFNWLRKSVRLSATFLDRRQMRRADEFLMSVAALCADRRWWIINFSRPVGCWLELFISPPDQASLRLEQCRPGVVRVDRIVLHSNGFDSALTANFCKEIRNRHRPDLPFSVPVFQDFYPVLGPRKLSSSLVFFFILEIFLVHNLGRSLMWVIYSVTRVSKNVNTF